MHTEGVAHVTNKILFPSVIFQTPYMLVRHAFMGALSSIHTSLQETRAKHEENTMLIGIRDKHVCFLLMGKGCHETSII